MIKLYRYELKRLIINKFFIGLLLVTAVYSWQLLSGEIVLGIAYTAPFSGWSYGTFLARVSPLLLVTLLFFITYLYSEQEKRVQALTRVTPVDSVQYGAVKCMAIITGYLLISCVVIIISLVFYAKIFRFYDFGVFLVPMIITLLPSMLLVLGVGMTAGRIHPALLYALMLVILLVGKFSLPDTLDFIGGAFFQTTPLTLPVGTSGEPGFIIPSTIAFSKIGFSVFGIVLTGAGLIAFNRRAGE